MEKISRFFQRIGMDPRTTPEMTVDFLGRVQTGCVTHITYENLDITVSETDFHRVSTIVVVRGERDDERDARDKDKEKDKERTTV